MATITLGIGTSHTPMLSMTAASWEQWGTRDAQKTDLRDDTGAPVSYEELASRIDGRLEPQLTQAVYGSKIARCEAALNTLAARVSAAKLDAIVVIGDDQNEHFGVENLPSVLVYHGETLRNTKAAPPPGAPREIVEMTEGYYELHEDFDYPVDAVLACNMIDFLLDHGFDVATSAKLPKDRAEGHALQFPHRRILGRELPVVPVLLNTYLPPSQPRAGRCFDLGAAMAAAVMEFGEDRRVGFLGSGGLSHFVVMQDWDRAFLQALRSKDQNYLRNIPEVQLQSGTSESKNWIATAGACQELQFEEIDYVPGYRTIAGTGTGMAFGVWS